MTNSGPVVHQRERDEQAEAIELIVPANSRHAITARLLAASVAADAGFSIDEIDDVRLALSEAFALFEPDDGGRIRISFTASQRRLELRVSDEAGRAPIEPDPVAHSILRSVVASYLVDATSVVLRVEASEIDNP